ncbi:MAG: phosphoenolpyruvate--protein phosphotransferase [Gammaproteobacteria bacterium]|nr:phosphoenolpyruvate--protein phosphotransferase [Gammaproteobacteria bacterium]MCP5200659.1 phosphoenolpyruvate--protein phosphotransferase [Gammaproteobacteria bacterium]
MTFTLHGVAVSRGIAIGRVHVVERHHLEISEIRLAEDEVAAEVERLEAALALARHHLRQIRDDIPSTTPAEIAAFIDTHLLMLEDAAFSEEPLRLVRELRCNAEWAVKLQRDKLVAAFEEMDDAYLRTRRDDVDNVVERLFRTLLRHKPLRHEMPDQKLKDMIVLARDLAPPDLVLLQHHGVAGFITEHGGPTSHMSILARSMGIPGVVGLHHARRYIEEDETVILDGEDGVVIGGAEAGILAEYRARQAARTRFIAGLQVLREAPAQTLDGVPISLQANVELASDFRSVRDCGASGVGLYRTEFLFLDHADYPDEEEHFATYRQMVAALDGAPLTIRTADLGADKPFGQDDGAFAANPALGLRAVRLCLREPSLFWPQLRAIIRASALGPVRMMIPMLSAVEEVRQVRDIVTTIRKEFTRRGIAFDAAMPIGGMIEVPAAAMCADLFAAELDFLSIGTNDLIQYSVAIDRVNDEVSYLYDPLNPGVLRLIATTLEAGDKAGIPVAMCGEMAGDPRYTRLLIGLGLNEFSVHPSALLEIKHAINGTSAARARETAGQLLGVSDGAQRRELLDALNA